MFNNTRVSISSALLLATCITTTANAAQQYILQDLGEIPAGTGDSVHINDAGHYSLPVINADDSISVIIKSGTEIKTISDFGFGGLTIHELNNNDHAVGRAISEPLPTKYSALYYDAVTSHNIETIPSLDSTANSINNNNQIVGEIRLNYAKPYYNDNPTRGFIYDLATANMVLLDDQFVPTSPFVYPSMESAKSINDSGVITGDSSFRDQCNNSISFCQAYTFDGTNITELGYLKTNKSDPVTSSGERSQGQAINSLGHVAGYSDRIGGVIYTSNVSTFDLIGGIGDIPTTPPFYPDPYHVFFYDGTSMSDLGALSVNGIDAASIVSDMNDNNTIVGYTLFSDKTAFMVTPRTTMMDLNQLIPVDSDWNKLNAATDINNNEVIVGYGIRNGTTHAFMLKPMNGADAACLHAPVKACEIVQCKVAGICN